MIIPQYKDFIGNNASSRHALLTIILVHHMFEWVHQEKFTKDRFKSTYPSENEMADIFDLARKIANGTKHFKQRERTSTYTQRGHSSGFSDGFSRPLNVEFPDGSPESADIFLRKMVEFWERQEL